MYYEDNNSDNYYFCENCSNQIPLEDLELHLKVCIDSRLLEKCPLCQLELRLEDLRDHLEAHKLAEELEGKRSNINTEAIYNSVANINSSRNNYPNPISNNLPPSRISKTQIISQDPPFIYNPPNQRIIPANYPPNNPNIMPANYPPNEKIKPAFFAPQFNPYPGIQGYFPHNNRQILPPINFNPSPPSDNRPRFPPRNFNPPIQEKPPIKKPGEIDKGMYLPDNIRLSTLTFEDVSPEEIAKRYEHPLKQETLDKLPTGTFNDVSHLPDEKKKCSICLENFEIGEEYITLPCLHIFHSECIKNWLKSQNTCPIDKFKVEEE